MRYERYKFERFLKVRTKLNINTIDKLPLELNVSKLGQSYRYYDPVPIMMARCLGEVKSEGEEVKEAMK